MSKLPLLLLLLLPVGVVLAGKPSKQANIADFPYHVSVRRDGRHVCSGALVHESWTITPASCVYEFAVPRISVLAGTSDLSRWTDGARILNVSKIVVHQGFDKDLLTNDIALIKTSRPTSDLPILLPSSDKYQLRAGSVLRLVGWLSGSGRLAAEAAPLVNQRSCALAMPRHRALTAKMLCATSENSCQVDVGAVLANDDVLVGVLSSADASCEYPSVYTRLGGFLPWINKVLALDNVAAFTAVA